MRFAKLGELRDEVRHAAGPMAYAALRRLWREWDQGDPAEVEEILLETEEDTALPAPTRAYSGLLAAYARRRRGDLDGARAKVARLGFVDRWLAVGPFDNEGKSGLDRAFGPEVERTSPPSLSKSYPGKERPVRWRVVPSVSPYGWVDLGASERPTEKICSYLSTFVRDAPSGKDARTAAARPLSLWAGSAGSLRVFWNGAEVLRDSKYRDLDADRFAARVVLAPGWNRLLVKVCGEDNAPILALRIAGPDGSPAAAHVEVDANPEVGDGGGGVAPQKELSLAAAPPPTGPIAAFEQLTRGGDPAMLEAYARYLVLTQSDDPSEHKARELARRAAEKAPTINRLLLAGALAEGRNQRAVWIDKAEEVVARGGGTREERLDVLLARAAHVRGGANWRDAVPIYERVLAVDPDNVPATLARFELFAAADLHDTALTLLSESLKLRPRSVALLRAMASALADKDRSTEAEEVEERYAALRFDDPGYAKERIRLAIARRDPARATRWVDRLLATNPDSTENLSVAAHAYVALGDRARAIATYRRALELAPEDTDTLRALADVYGAAGQRDEQTKLLRQVLALSPQAKDVREHLSHLEPAKPRADEAYARPRAEFLAQRNAAADGHDRRDLVNLTVTTVFPNGLASRFHQVVFQPMTEAAAAEAREYAFGFSADTETVQLRGSRVYRANGEVDEAIESGDGPADNAAIATYTSSRVFYVHFPRLNPGDVVELLYRVEDISPTNAFADYFGEVDYMQTDVPVARAEYVLVTPKSRTFYFNEPKIPGLQRDVQESGEQRVYRFTALNVPALDPEPGAPPLSETAGHVHVSTYRSWDEMASWYWGLVKDQFVADDEVRRRVAIATSGLTDERARVRAVYDYVVQKTRYVALEFGIHGFKPYSCSQIFARGFGDCKDKATLIVTMLKELGIPATIVIVRTGLRGDFDPNPASLAPFDHAIAYVPSLDLYLDGTAEYSGSSELPAMDRGALALQVNEGHAKLVHLPDPPASESSTTRTVDVVMNADGTAQVDWRADIRGVSAAGYRMRYHADVSRKQRLTEDLGGELGGLDISSVDAPGLDDVEKPVSLHVRARARELARKDAGSLSVPVGPRDRLVRELAPLSQRRQGVRIPSRTETISDWTIHLPTGMSIQRAPQSMDAKSPFGGVRVEVDHSPAAVHVKTSVSIDVSRVSAADYPAFRAWCEQADRALGQRVVIARGGGE